MMPYEIIEKEMVIGMPPGIGDLHWIMAKLESFKEKNNIKKIKVVMNLGHEENKSFHDCSLQYLELVPFVDSAESVLDMIPFEYALAGGSGKPLFKDHGGCDYMIELNSRLEQGVKLKNILPEYDTNFDYPLDEPSHAKEFAKAVKGKVGGKLALFFTASIGGNDVWVKDLWTANEWMELARKTYGETGCKVVLIGAKWDADYAEKLMELDSDDIIHDMTGKTSVVQLFALIREANILVAFQCGVVMMATKFRTPVAGFWPIEGRANPHGQFKRSFMRTWTPPWVDKVGFMPFGWGDKNATPDGVFSAIRSYL